MSLAPLFTSLKADDPTQVGFFKPSDLNAITGLLTRLFDQADADGTVLTRDALSINGASWQTPAGGGGGASAWGGITGTLASQTDLVARLPPTGVATGAVAVSSGVGAAPAWSASPFLSGDLTLGVQGTSTSKLIFAHAEPGGGNSDAHFCIFPLVTTFTNSGTYYDHTIGFGWNADGVSLTQPVAALQIESKYSQGGASPFAVEFHHQVNHTDAWQTRVFSNTVDITSPHLANTAIAGNVVFYNSSSVVGQVTNAQIGETGVFQLFNGSAFIIQNYASGASAVGKGAFQIVSSDGAPDLRWSVGGSIKARLEIDAANGGMIARLSTGSNPYFWIDSAPLVISGRTAAALPTHPILDLSETWNNAAVAFTGLKHVILDTASAAESMALQMFGGAGGGTALFSVSKAGAVVTNSTITAGGNLVTASAGNVVYGARSVINSPADGVVKLSNQAETDFTRLQFGGTTSAYPALKRSGAALVVRLADDSVDANLTVGSLTTSVGGVVSAGALTMLNAGNAGEIRWSSVALSTITAGALTVENAARTIGSNLKVDAVPTVASGFGTSPAVTGGSTPLAGSVNVGTGGVATSGVINFNGTAFPSAPFVVCMNTTTGAVVRAVATTTQLTITAPVAFVANDVITWLCISSR